MVFKNSILCGFLMLLLPILFVGCVVTPIYNYDWWEYQPIDYIGKQKIEYVYIPRERPIRFYRYNDWWYTEPYTILILQDSRGRSIREKVPNSHLRRRLKKQRPIMKRKKDVESIMKDINKMKQHQNRQKNKRRVRKRT